MTTEQRNEIIKMQDVLTKIQDGISVFFNLTAYKNMGLIVDSNVYGTGSTGNKIVVGTKYTLTPKAKKIVNTII